MIKSKVITRWAVAACLAVAMEACGSDEPANPAGGGTDTGTDPAPTETLETAKDGRICLAYAPYYRTSLLPNPAIVTHINYAFAEVYVVNGEYKTFKLQGDNDEAQFRKVVALKSQNPKLKICLSFSHTVVNSDNQQAGGFSDIAASDDNRRRFAADCLAFVQRWGIDGIDLDWEFPGISWSGAKCDPAHDVDNFTLLVKQLRETLGNRYLLTFAGYVMDKQPTSGGWRYIDLKAVLPYVDFINIMTYDLQSNKPHSAVDQPSAYWDIERTRKAYLAAGVPYEKMVLGIPFYVRHSFDGPNSAVDWKDLNALAASDKAFKIDNWDSEAQTPYVTYNGQFWGGYDNPESIAKKGRRYVGGFGMKGMLYWDCGADDARYTLSKACWNAVMKSY